MFNLVFYAMERTLKQCSTNGSLEISATSWDYVFYAIIPAFLAYSHAYTLFENFFASSASFPGGKHQTRPQTHEGSRVWGRDQQPWHGMAVQCHVFKVQSSFSTAPLGDGTTQHNHTAHTKLVFLETCKRYIGLGQWKRFHCVVALGSVAHMHSSMLFERGYSKLGTNYNGMLVGQPIHTSTSRCTPCQLLTSEDHHSKQQSWIFANNNFQSVFTRNLHL